MNFDNRTLKGQYTLFMNNSIENDQKSTEEFFSDLS